MRGSRWATCTWVNFHLISNWDSFEKIELTNWIPNIDQSCFWLICSSLDKSLFKWPCGQFLRQKQWCSDTWCPENHPSHTHKRVLAWGSRSKTKSNKKYLFLPICCQPTLATKINKTMCQRTYSNSHVATIVTTKIIFYSKYFWDKMLSQNEKQRYKTLCCFRWRVLQWPIAKPVRKLSKKLQQNR